MKSFNVSDQCDQDNPEGHTDKRYKYKTMSPEFLRSDTWIAILDSLISRLENINPMQSRLDTFYNDMLSKFFNEMDNHIMYNSASERL